MKKIFIINLLVTLFGINIIYSQTMITNDGEWNISDCFSGPSGSECFTHKYSFEQTIRIDTNEYFILKTDSNYNTFRYGKYYRETNGKVFMRFSEDEPEILIYDFKLNLYDQFEIKSGLEPRFIEVAEIDSIILLSGEKRKRLKMMTLSSSPEEGYWIEGIGSEYGTMNPASMFTVDASVKLNCYWQRDTLTYQNGPCDITTKLLELSNFEKPTFYPNPINNEIVFSNFRNNSIKDVVISDIKGNIIKKIKILNYNRINVENLETGLYIIQYLFNEKIYSEKIIKK